LLASSPKRRLPTHLVSPAQSEEASQAGARSRRWPFALSHATALQIAAAARAAVTPMQHFGDWASAGNETKNKRLNNWPPQPMRANFCHRFRRTRILLQLFA